MRCAILGFVAGVAFLQTCAALPDPRHLLACALAASVLPALRGPGRLARTACAGSVLGFCWAAVLAHAALSHELGKLEEGRNLEIIGTVAKLPHDFGEGVRFQFAVDAVLDATARVPPRLALSWYGAGEQVRLRPGERWRLTVRLQRPHGNANPHVRMS